MSWLSFTGSPLRRATIACAAACPSLRCGTWIEVSHLRRTDEIGMSPQPVMPMSSGTRNPTRSQYWNPPNAIESFWKNTHAICAPVASNCSVP